MRKAYGQAKFLKSKPRGVDMEGCVLWLPFYKYGAEVQKIWDQSQGHPEQIVNGGFESWASSTDANGWTEYLGGTSTINRESSSPHGGIYCTRLDISAANDNAQMVSTVMTLIPGEQYKLSLWYKNSLTAKTGCIVVYDSGSNVFLHSDGTWGGADSITLTNSTSWAYYEIIFTAHTSYSLYYFELARNAAASSSIYYDDVSVTPCDTISNRNHGTITGAVPAAYPITGTVQEGSELIGPNGGMEDGNPPTGWSAYISPAVFEQSSVQHHFGNYSAHIVVNDSVERGMSRSITTCVVGHKYKVSGWIYKISGSNPVVLWMDSIYALTNSSNVWEYLEFVFTATVTTPTMYSYNAGPTPAEWYVDDISVVEVQGPELVYNGTMETGNPPTGYSTGNSPETFERSAVQKHSGSYSAHLVDSVASNGAFYQENLPQTINKRYKFSCWYYIVSGSINIGITNETGGSWLDVQTKTTTGVWAYHEVIIIATGTGSNGQIWFYNYSGEVAAEFYIDDVSVQEVTGYEGIGWQTDGTDDYFDCGTNPSLDITNTISILTWIKPSTEYLNTGVVSEFITRGSSAADGFFSYNYQGMNFVSNQAGTSQQQPMIAGTLVPDVWQQVSFTKSGVNGLWYVNGVDKTDTHGDLTNMAPSTKNLYLARYNTAVNYGKLGWGEVLIFNRTLSAQEIKNYYELTRHIYGV